MNQTLGVMAIAALAGSFVCQAAAQESFDVGLAEAFDQCEDREWSRFAAILRDEMDRREIDRANSPSTNWYRQSTKVEDYVVSLDQSYTTFQMSEEGDAYSLRMDVNVTVDLRDITSISLKRVDQGGYALTLFCVDLGKCVTQIVNSVSVGGFMDPDKPGGINDFDENWGYRFDAIDRLSLFTSIDYVEAEQLEQLLENAKAHGKLEYKLRFDIEYPDYD